MKITLLSRSFTSRTHGTGVYSKMFYDSIKDEKEFNINIVSQDNSFFQNFPLSLLFFSFIEILFRFKKGDIYHALTPNESIYLNKKKSIVTIHDLIIKRMDLSKHNDISLYFQKIFYLFAVKKAIKSKQIIAVSQETANDLVEFYNVDSDKIKVIRPPINEKFKPLNKKKKDDSYVIGTISALAERKRVDILIKSFLKADIQNSELLIGGNGKEYDYLKKLANNDPRIKFLGFIDDDDVNDFYNSLDVFVFPTSIEGYGMPIVEAMACEVPVITLDDAYIPKDVQNYTFITSSSNLANVLKNKSFKCNIEENLMFAKEHSPKIIKNQIIELYNSFYSN